MLARPRPMRTRLVIGAVLIAVALLAVWVVAPEVTLVILLLLGAAAEMILYAVLYVIQRRRHW